MTLTITQKSGHFAWCALVALHLAEQDGQVKSDIQKNLFLIRWLATAKKQRRFDRTVTADIDWLLRQGRTLGVRAKLPQKLDYLYHSCTGTLNDQSDLFRLTYAFESAKEAGFSYQILNHKAWHGRHALIPDNTRNALYLFNVALDAAFDSNGKQIARLPVKISGDIAGFTALLKSCGWQLNPAQETAMPFLYSLTANNEND